MPRKNKSGKGKDQKGVDYTISYQPDWLKAFKSSRKDKKGKKGTATIFQNPEKYRKEDPGKTVTTKVSSAEGVDFTVTVDDPKRAIKRIRVEYRVIKERATAGGAGTSKKAVKRSNEVVVYTLEDDQPPPPPPPPPTDPSDGG